MRILLRSLDRTPLGQVDLAEGDRPIRAKTDLGHDVILDWEAAHDDDGHLRRCPACGSADLYRHRRVPQITGFILVLVLAMTLASILGLVSGLSFLIAIAIIILIDVCILVLSPESLECYRCRTSIRNIRIAAYHQKWNRERDRTVNSEN